MMHNPALSPGTPRKNKKEKSKKQKKQKKQENKQIINKIENLTKQKCYNMRDAMQKLNAHQGWVNAHNLSGRSSLIEQINRDRNNIHITGSLMTMNMRGGITKKMEKLDMLEMWNVMESYNVVSLAMQDHQFSNANTAVMNEMK